MHVLVFALFTLIVPRTGQALVLPAMSRLGLHVLKCQTVRFLAKANIDTVTRRFASHDHYRPALGASYQVRRTANGQA